MAVGACSLPVKVTKPNGVRFNLRWTYVERCSALTPTGCDTGTAYYRFAGVSSSAGYSFTVNYASSNDGGLQNTGAPPPAWYQKTGVTFANSVTACGTSCPSLTYTNASGITTVTDGLGRQWRFDNHINGQLIGIRRPGEATDSTSIGYDSNSAVLSVTHDGVANSYARTVAGNVSTTVITDPLSKSKTVTADLSLGQITSVKDELNRTTSYQYDANGRPTKLTLPEGNYDQLTYDARGNLTQKVSVAKSGSPLANVTVSAAYPATCTNAITCNKPTSTTDANANVTDFTYDPTHGGLLTVTAPAPATGGVRPQMRQTYTLVAPAVAGEPSAYMLTGKSACQSLASCSGNSDEVKATIGYNSSFLPLSMSAGDGSGALTATQTMTYDPSGNVLTVDGPLAGTADTTAYKYDVAREKVGVISPDPDGAGPLKMRAARFTYRADGQVSKQEKGTVISQSDADWVNFVPSEVVDVGYDGNARVITQKLSNGGINYALTQSSYDALGRSDCVATRMNTAVYGALPATACTLSTQGSLGPDQITRSVYDAAGQIIAHKVAVATADEAADASYAYTSNGELASLVDGEANKTSYVYDGLDRLSQTQYPSSTRGAGTSNPGDYEQLSYDAASNVTARRLRDATSIAFTYDKLNRPTFKDLPGSEPDVTYGYDNLGRLTSASKSGNAQAFTYDALGRNLTQVSPQGTVTSAWDVGGRRTLLTYPGSGLAVNYDFLVTGETSKIRENGATSGIGVLATFGYDDLGRRTSLNRGNGTVTSYGFDPVSRLATLAEDLAGTTNDQSASFSYSPANQIMGISKSNDLYAWTGHGAGSTSSVTNGLNQLTSIGGASTAHDARGNLTTDPTTGKVYVYSSENLLISGSGGVNLNYDPLMRLGQLSSTVTTRFGYDGMDLIAEYDGNNSLLRRYVHGPEADEPLVQYEGAGTTDRRFVHSDERGSVVALSDGTGTVLTTNRYDEYGKPQSTNAGRFQYTGQTWLPELGLYYYKTRMYAPQLGRFMQPDSVGYDGGQTFTTTWAAIL